MRCLLLLLLVPSTASAETELHYFTQNTCRPCVPVTKIVRALNAHDRDIIVHVWEEDERPFQQYGADWLPMFIQIENGKETARYVQNAKTNRFFTGSFVSGIAPFKEQTTRSNPPATDCVDCADPIKKIIRNIIPPPPAPNLPRDVPDRQKVARIEALELLVRDMRLTINVLRAEVAEFQAITSGKDGVDGRDGKDGADGKTGSAGPSGASLSAAELTELRSLRIEVNILKALPRRFVIVDGNSVLGDLTYEPGEPVVIDRQVILMGDE
tara:strand:- start:2102 stop:2908 length:807 start_codon:yes stop_codon:yes gene_type:complete